MPRTDPQIDTVASLVREQTGKFYGTYRGKVVDNVDERNRGRLLVEVPTVLGVGVHKWAMGKFPFGGNSTEGAIFVPAKGSHVLVEFVEGSPGSPIWAGCYYPEDAEAGAAATPPESFDLAAGQLHMIRTAMGLELRLEDTRKSEDDGGEQRLVIRHPAGARIVVDAKGVIDLTDPEGGQVMLDPANKIARLKGQGDGLLEMKEGSVVLKHGGTELKLDSTGVTVTAGKINLDGDSIGLGKGATSGVLNADAFVGTVFAAHTHPTPAGPSGPPVPLGTPAQATSLKKVKGA